MTTTCTITGCDWPTHAKTLCKPHYDDTYHRKPLRQTPAYTTVEHPICKSIGCGRPVHGHGYCKTHCEAARRVKNLGYPYRKNLTDAQRKLAQAEAEMNRYRVWRYRQMLRIDGLV